MMSVRLFYEVAVGVLRQPVDTVVSTEYLSCIWSYVAAIYIFLLQFKIMSLRCHISKSRLHPAEADICLSVSEVYEVPY
jgi:beta-lactamase regulating signal transducer with metallopeptidase domain